MLRRLLSPRWLAMLGALAAAVTACVLLGLWQLGVARDSGRQDAIAAASRLERAPLASVTAPHTAFRPELSNRPVTVTGRYDASRSFLVVDRRLGDERGSWVLTPLETPGGTVVVLRGFVPGTATAAPPPPGGTVTVEGTLGPGESPRVGEPLPQGQRRSVDLAELVNEWPDDLYDAVVFASGERVGDASGTPVQGAPTRVPPPTLDAPLNLRNAAYAVQWWVFAVFAVWMWWKMFRAEDEAEVGAGDEVDAPTDDGPGPSPHDARDGVHPHDREGATT